MKKMILAMMIAMLVIPAIGAKAENVEFDISLVHYTNKTPFTLIGKAAQGSDVTMRGKPVAKIGDDGVFKIDLEVKEGDNVFHFKATKDGQSTTKGILVQMRTTPPNALFLIDGILTDQASIEVTTQDATEASLIGFAEPDCKIICDGVDYSSNNIKFEAKFKADPAPSITIHKLDVIDKYGNNKTTVIRSINYHKRTILMQINNTLAMIDRKEVYLTNPPKIIKGSTMIPARSIGGDIFEGVVDFNPDTKTITITKGSIELSAQIGNNMASLNGKQVRIIGSPPTIVNNSFYVPVRFFGESFYYKVFYDAKTMVITMTQDIYL